MSRRYGYRAQKGKDAMPSNPYTQAYTENLIASLTRTRDELKDVIADLMTKADVNTTPTARKLAARLHRTVGSITDDLQG